MSSKISKIYVEKEGKNIKYFNVMLGIAHLSFSFYCPYLPYYLNFGQAPSLNLESIKLCEGDEIWSSEPTDYEIEPKGTLTKPKFAT